MKLLAVSSAKTIWLVPTIFLNPNGVAIWPFFAAIKERYAFQTVPTSKPQVERDGWKFEAGAFTVADGLRVIVNATIHLDGIVVETRSSTTNGDLFLEDLLEWASREYGLASYRTLPISKIYASEVFVAFDKTPRLLDRKLDPLVKKASEQICDKRTGPLDVMGVIFSTDPELSDRPLTFRVERQAAAPFSQNHYFSFASTETEKHLGLLRQLEELG